MEGGWYRVGYHHVVGYHVFCFYGFLQAGEAAASADGEFHPSQHLSYADVAVDNVRQPSYLAVQIKQSKTDPFRKGVQVIIGRTGGPLCPVVAILAYMVLRKPGEGPLFRFKDGRPLTRVLL